VVVVAGVTVAVPDGLTVPTVGEMLTEVALGTFHDSVDDWPAPIWLGVALNRTTCNARCVVTVVEALALSPLT
jgi:hypothetical protein